MICGHEVQMKCCEDPESKNCTKKCVKTLPCGHPCAGMCKDQCTLVPCQIKVELDKPGLCGHTFSVPCHLKNSGKFYYQFLDRKKYFFLSS